MSTLRNIWGHRSISSTSVNFNPSTFTHSQRRISRPCGAGHRGGVWHLGIGKNDSCDVAAELVPLGIVFGTKHSDLCSCFSARHRLGGARVVGVRTSLVRRNGRKFATSFGTRNWAAEHREPSQTKALASRTMFGVLALALLLAHPGREKPCEQSSTIIGFRSMAAFLSQKAVSLHSLVLELAVGRIFDLPLLAFVQRLR